MYTFKVIEENKNPLESLIEKSGVTVKFTVQDVLDHLSYTEKVIRETTAQTEAEDMQNKLAEEAFPMLKDIPQEKMQLVMAYASRKVQRPISDGLIETSKKTLESYKEQLEQIKTDLGIDYQKANEEETDEGSKEEGQ